MVNHWNDKVKCGHCDDVMWMRNLKSHTNAMHKGFKQKFFSVQSGSIIDILNRKADQAQATQPVDGPDDSSSDDSSFNDSDRDDEKSQ